MAGGNYPVSITTGPDGALWFTQYESNKIGRITTAGVITEYPTSSPVLNVNVYDITAGPDGALWFTEQLGIGRITTNGVNTEYGQTTLSQPAGITTGPDGALWFTEPYRNIIGRITTAGAITVYLVPTADSEPSGIAAGPDGALWFTEVYGNKIGRITTKGVITEYPIPTAGSLASEITAGPDGAMWFTEWWSAKIGRITTAGVITEYAVSGFPGGITTGPDGALWFAESEGDSIGRITTDGVITEYSDFMLLGSLGITTGPDGALWFTDEGGQIGRLGIPPYVCTNTEPPVITSIKSASSFGGYPYFASGSWLEIQGTNLTDPFDPRLWASANPGQWTASDFNGVNAPTVLDGISASVNGKPAYVWYLSPLQINVQAPEDSFIGNVPVTVTNCNATSSQFNFPRQPLAPGLLAPASFNIGGTQYMVATFVSDGAYVLNASTATALGLTGRPAKPGDLIIAYGIGFGDVTPSIPPGVMAEQSNALVNPVAFSFGSANAAVAYAGLAGNFVGLYEFYITVPSNLANGDYSINVTQNGTNVPQTMYLTVQN